MQIQFVKQKKKLQISQIYDRYINEYKFQQNFSNPSLKKGGEGGKNQQPSNPPTTKKNSPLTGKVFIKTNFRVLTGDKNAITPLERAAASFD